MLSGVAQGSCGYGKLDKGNWPYWSVAALSSSNSFVNAGPINGCGCVPNATDEACQMLDRHICVSDQRLAYMH